MRKLSVFLTILLAPPLWGQSVKLPAEVRGAPGAWIIVAPESVEGGTPKWRMDPALQEVRLDLLLGEEAIKNLKGKVVTCLATGRYRVECWNAKGDTASDIATCWVVVGQAPPTPIPPDPVPPTPDPPKPVPPTPVTGLRVLMIYEKSTLLPGPQYNAMFGMSVRDYLNRKTAKTDGHVGWRIWDYNAEMGSSTPTWKAMWAAIKPQIQDPKKPWVAIGTDQNVTIYPLPATEAEMLNLLKKVGGD